MVNMYEMCVIGYFYLFSYNPMGFLITNATPQVSRLVNNYISSKIFRAETNFICVCTECSTMYS